VRERERATTRVESERRDRGRHEFAVVRFGREEQNASLFVSVGRESEGEERSIGAKNRKKLGKENTQSQIVAVPGEIYHLRILDIREARAKKEMGSCLVLLSQVSSCYP